MAADEFNEIGRATHVDGTGDLYYQKGDKQDWALCWTAPGYWGASVFKNFELDQMERFTKINKAGAGALLSSIGIRVKNGLKQILITVIVCVIAALFYLVIS